MSDRDVRASRAGAPVPVFDDPAFNPPPALSSATVAIVTTAGLMHPGEPWRMGDDGFRAFDRDDRDLIVGHVSMNFDRTGVAADRNVVYPIDRLEELAADGIIGAVAPRHVSFMGGLGDLTGITLDSGPAAGKLLLEDGVDVVVLTPTCPMCPRTINAVAHALERAGLSTVVLSSNLDYAQRMRPPRALFCEFPFGRPLGRPNDPAFQREVLLAGLRLLDAPEGPVLEVYPEVIDDEIDEPLACPVPPSYDPAAPPAVAEARALLPAWRRARNASGATQVGRAIAPEQVVDAVTRFAEVASGTAWQAAGFDSEDALVDQVMDIRAFYEEAAIVLSDHVPAARQVESWYCQHTAMGDLLAGVIEALRASKPRFSPVRLALMAPITQPRFATLLAPELAEIRASGAGMVR